MLLYKHKKHHADKGNRLLISITVLGSAGPIRFLVNEEEAVAAVIDTALKSYAREGRIPALGSDIHNFVLSCPNAETEALNPLETIGSLGVRNFMLCKKPQQQDNGGIIEDEVKSTRIGGRKSSHSWKAWFHKSISFKIYSH